MNAAGVTDAGGNSLRSSPRCQHTQCAAVWETGNEGQGVNPGYSQGWSRMDSVVATRKGTKGASRASTCLLKVIAKLDTHTLPAGQTAWIQPSHEGAALK